MLFRSESVSMAQAKAQEEQNPVNAALRATSIAFVTLAEAEMCIRDSVSDVKSAADDFFLVSLSEYGCERWEKILGLSVEPLSLIHI